METLIRTPFFCTLSQQSGTPVNGEDDLHADYKEFVSLSVQISISAAKGIPAYFTLNYTLAELVGLQDEMKSGAKKKCAH